MGLKKLALLSGLAMTLSTGCKTDQDHTADSSDIGTFTIQSYLDKPHRYEAKMVSDTIYPGFRQITFVTPKP